MTIRLTLKCSEFCKHCLVNALPTNNNIDKLTLDNCLKLLKYINPEFVNLSGGEITEMQNWYEIINYIINYISKNNLRTKLIVLSNGSFLQKESEKLKMLKLLEYNYIDLLYISTNKKFYKNFEKISELLKTFKSEKLKINLNNRLNNLKNLGRAKNLNVNLNTTTSCNLCNLQIKKYHKNLKDFFNLIPSLNCSPMINIDGNIYLGWSNECVSIGNINYNTYNEIYQNILNYKPCGKCKQKIS